MTLQLLHSEFPYLWGKIDFHFLSVCMWVVVVGRRRAFKGTGSQANYSMIQSEYWEVHLWKQIILHNNTCIIVKDMCHS
jgi:hypothetical protein